MPNRLHVGAAFALCSVLAPLTAFAQPKSKPPAEKSAVEHGSGKGDGDSRGPGAGDGRGRFRDDRGRDTNEGEEEGTDSVPAAADDVPPLAPAPVSEAPPSPLAVQLNDDFMVVPSVSYQARYRHEEGRDFVAGGVTNSIRHRARLGLAARYRSLARVFIQLQDVRTFGEEGDPAGDFAADAFDLHQGYLDLTPTPHLRFRLGRQEVDLANERLVGRPLFLEQSRSFDGLHFRFDEQVELEAGYFLVRDYSVGPVEEGRQNGKRHLGIGHLGYEVLRPFHPHVVVVVDGDTAIDRLVVTAGGLVTGNVGDDLELRYSAEGYYQGGQEGDVNVSAWLAGVSTRMTTPFFGSPFAEVHAVLISGDEEPDDPTMSTFASPYPRGHRIHGEMDFFINFPTDTEERGLRDIGGTLGWSPKKVRLTAAFHFFDAMASRPDGLSQFGFESDFKISYPFWDYARIDTLYGLFVPGDIKRAGLADPRVEHFVYATARVGF